MGEETEIDKTIVDSIGDPIMHIVRNSMDHGIEEDVQDRIRAGKDPVGEITLSARQTGSEVIIEIRDDGQGVNDEAVLRKAVKNGLPPPMWSTATVKSSTFSCLPASPPIPR